MNKNTEYSVFKSNHFSLMSLSLYFFTQYIGSQTLDRKSQQDLGMDQKRKFCGPISDLLESLTLGLGAREFLLTVLPGDSNVHEGLKNHCSNTHFKRVNKRYK